MSRQIRRVLRTVASILPALLAAPRLQAAPPDAPAVVPPVRNVDPAASLSQSRILVRLAPGVQPAAHASMGIRAVDQALARRAVAAIRPALSFAPADAALAARIGLDRWWVITLPQGAPQLALELAAFPDIFELAEPDGLGGPAEVIPSDPFFDIQWGLRNTGQAIPNLGDGVPGADISAPDAWGLFTPQRGLVLAVIDAGVDAHTELAGRLLPGFCTIEGENDTTDQCAHGTHVSGIAAAAGNNGVGIAGVCWWASILPVRVIEADCSGVESQTAAGIVWAADHGASIANMSLRFYTGTQILADAVEYASGRGMLLIAAAGNNAGDRVAYPAKFDHCMAVAATDNCDTRPLWSNFGPEVDTAAPGANIYSLLGTSDYKYSSGTSMATPHVSGLACLIWSRDPALSADEVASIILDTADDIGDPGWDEMSGSGRINAAAALGATPCYADLSGDGQITFFDYLVFQNAMNSKDPIADCDRSSGAGVFDLFDFLCYQNAFMQGCP